MTARPRVSLRDWITTTSPPPLTPERLDDLVEKVKQQGHWKAKQQSYCPRPPPRPRCVCGHPLDEHDETGRCIPMVMIDASQGMGVLVQGRCSYDCREPKPMK